MRRTVGQTLGAPGLWIGVTAASLVASLAMVQIRCKFSENFACGDWPWDGYTWHFWPPFLLLLLVWTRAARVWSQRVSRSMYEGLCAHGEAASPMLGLVVAWGWYGLMGRQFHAPACTIPVLCHDAMPLSIVLWSAPWIVWGVWRISLLWRTGDESV